ncbi:hypothetical protein NX801_16400 [Streptomyces sp. LP05-1]|uniref:DUF3592 domain-containing protein n=1 Tax=Streptomyces pyxinae TaxID=2970734 RepID=A0ABT2CIG6_9ACTN|nr:DUF3592 domain-containing protein [Streptomyces sp. LP05-1]MCS0637214.1 hypothetical protein [Streptomyces sp. LP05-1]
MIFLFWLGVAMAVLGAVFLVGCTGNLLEFRRLRLLERRGVQGEAVARYQNWMNGKYRVCYEVRLPEGRRRSQFYEFSTARPEPMGTVVPVVYDERKPSRARTGTLDAIDPSGEGRVVAGAGGFGAVALVLGLVIAIVFAP